MKQYGNNGRAISAIISSTGVKKRNEDNKHIDRKDKRFQTILDKEIQKLKNK